MGPLPTITLRDYQERGVAGLRKAYAEGKRSPLLALPTGGGKCLGKGTPILMFDGSIRPVEDIRVGDRLMGPDSRPRRVLSTCRGVEALYRVTPVKGDPYVVNESHILSLKTTPDGKGQAGGSIVNIGVRDWLAASRTFRHTHKGWRAAVDFPRSQDVRLISPYMLGAWLGDGSSRHFSITTGDPEIEAEVRAFADAIGWTIREEPNSPGSKILHVVKPENQARKPGRRGAELMGDLRHYGLVQNEHIPHAFKTASRQDRLELLAGILDTDGHWTGKDYALTLKSERLMDDVIFVARSLGFSAYKRQVTKTCCNNGVQGQYFNCHINGPVESIPCRVKRKQAPPRRQKKNPLVTGITVEPIGPGEYFGFEIDGDHLFMLGDFTVTHNTVVFCYVAANAAAKGRRVLILVHRAELLRQTSRSLERMGVRHGLIAPGCSQTLDAVQVASVQTLVRRIGKIAWLPDLIVIDEAHHAVAGTWAAALSAFPKAHRLGVTATPCRLDGRGLGDVFEHLVIGPSTSELMARGFLSRAIVYAPPVRADFAGVKIVGGDFSRGEAAARMDKPAIIGDAVQHYRRLIPGKPAIAFCASVDHAEHTAALFNAAGFIAKSLDGTMEDSERADTIAALGDGRIHVLTSCDIVSEGTDIPVVTGAILLRPTQSEALYLQQVGRVLRPIYADGFDLSTDAGRLAAIAAGPKPRAVILDHVGNVARHGLPDDDREWSLDVTRRKPKRKDEDECPVRQCPQCYIAHKPAPACPGCGFVYPVKQRDMEQRDGELVEVTAEMVARKQKRMEVGQARTLADLQQIERERGYKAGWAHHVWSSRTATRRAV
ncbi:MAG: Klebsiella phage [Planctomycetota bacterium]|jgi:superfamily II DNA or RNA helicase